jgi:DNA-binding IclR family transcriptional regulator
MSSTRSDAEYKVMRAIDLFHTSHGYGPSFRDLAEEVGLALGTVHAIVVSLREQGKVTYDDNRARSMDIA